jgi:hypothetical protein
VSESPNADLAENLAFFQRASKDIVGIFLGIATKTLTQAWLLSLTCPAIVFGGKGNF